MFDHLKVLFRQTLTPSVPKIDPRTLDTIRDFLAALSRLLLAIEGMEEYWKIRFYKPKQHGVPLIATWEQVEAVGPVWDALYRFCNQIRFSIARDDFKISRLMPLDAK